MVWEVGARFCAFCTEHTNIWWWPESLATRAPGSRIPADGSPKTLPIYSAVWVCSNVPHLKVRQVPNEEKEVGSIVSRRQASRPWFCSVDMYIYRPITPSLPNIYLPSEVYTAFTCLCIYICRSKVERRQIPAYVGKYVTVRIGLYSS